MKAKKGNVSVNGSQNDSVVKTPAAKTPAKGTPAKATPKKMAKTPAKVVPPKEVVPEEEEDNEEEDDSGADVAAEVHEEAEESDGDEEVEGDEEDDDDEQPDEAPVGKEAPKPKKVKNANANNETGVPKIKTGALPKTFPKNQVLIVKNLPSSYKQIDMVEVFGKFGALHTIYNNHGPAGSTAFVAYHSPEEAEAAQVATDNIATIKGNTISVTLQLTGKKIKGAEERKKLAEEKKAAYEEKKRLNEESKDRTIYIKNIKRTTTDDQLKELFADCGEVEEVRRVNRPHNTFAFLTFTEESAVSPALNRHNTIIDGVNIFVSKAEKDQKEPVKERDPERTVLVRNKQNLECVEIEKMEKIFSKFGEIENISLLCSKNVLAFVSYKLPKSAKKALQLNGTTAEDLELEVEEYKVVTPKSRSAVFIQNVKPDVTEEEIRDLFAPCGPIENIVVNPSGYAIVKFENVDAFCKAFALNETTLHGNILFLQPYSEKKQLVLKKNHSPFGNRKRQSGGSPFNRSGFGKKRKMF